MVAAHKWLGSDGGELRLVVPAGGAVGRVLTLLGVDDFIDCIASLEEAVAAAAEGAYRRSGPGGSNADQHQIKS